MGYRSDVTAIFYAPEKDWPVVKLWLDENRPNSIISEGEFNEYSNGRHGVKGYYVEWDSVKWYDSYSDVQDFNSFVSNYITLFCAIKEGKINGCYEFVRIGENYEDIEVQREGDYNFVLEINRSVEVV